MSGLISNENGLTVGIYQAVLDKLAREAPGAGQETSAANVVYTQVGAGAVPYSAAKKLLSLPKSVGEFATGDDISTAVQLSSEAAKYAPEREVVSYENRWGADVAAGMIAHNRTTGRVHNPRQQFTARTFGQETMQHWFGCFAGSSNVNGGDNVIRRIVISGPSTIFGVGATYGTPSALLEDLAETRGYSNVGVINRGQSGKGTHHWLADYLDGDLAANPDLLILQWPVNDPYYSRTVEQSIDDFRAGMARIRAVRPVSGLSIVVMTPAPMNDVEKGRTEVRAEQLSLGLRQAAADFDCAFFDTYAYYQNAHSAAGLWMDKDTTFNPAGRAIHPHDVFYEHIFGRLAAELVFPAWGTGWITNNFRNPSAGDTASLKTGEELPSSYFSGIGFYRMAEGTGSANGGPFNGVAYTFKQADGAALQFCVPLVGVTAGSGITARIGFNNQWSDWYGMKRAGAALLVGGWHNVGAPFADFSYRLMMEGDLSLSGLIAVGDATVDGTLIGTLPGGYRPTADELLLVGTENGTCKLRVGADGTMRVYGFGAGGGYIILSGVSFAL